MDLNTRISWLSDDHETWVTVPDRSKTGLDIQKYLDFIESTRDYAGDSYADKEERLYGLIAEVGELAALKQKKIRDGKFNMGDYVSELGDVLYYILALINFHTLREPEQTTNSFNLEDVINFNMEKLKKRGMVK